MIVYNMRYRGPLEYDKFVLNAFQFHNEVDAVLIKEFENSSNSKAFNQISAEMDNKLADFIGREKSIELELSEKIGYSKDLYMFLLEFREV